MTTRLRPHVLLWNADDGELERALGALDIRLSVACDDAGAPVPAAAIGVADIDGLILSAAQISAALLERLCRDAPRLRWIHLTNAGYDNVQGQPLPAGLVVTHTPGAGATTVAEHGVGLMLALGRGIPDALDEQRRRHWNYALGGRLVSLQGRTAMILGFGHIGKALARLLRAFGMRVIAVSRRGDADGLADASCTLAGVDTHLPQVDFVAIALPLTPETDRFFDAARLALLSPGAFLVNLSRGGIVDAAALATRLEAGGLAGAAIDVASPEPLPAGHPLWSAPNLIITPHTAAAGPTPHDRAHMVALTAENARRFAQDEPLLHVVDCAAREAA
ncbi:D-2-hydroxyacid dehydrogenase [Sphingomonas flavalba]|uniref:D-2-hydroxyacid dehydrogenase n=1 Tax=Sphingomonas flavalba TaxID=2559804 RepID=UPI001445F727|nr:D-2-hydroxyacid dehydrogenase [Sphingomonas flavalba]